MKRRIESLLQVGKTKEAIALAKKANLVCRGTAFVAWDDAEEVAIAQDEVYQPSLDLPSGVSCSTPAPRASFMAFSGAAYMPASRSASPAKRPSSFKNNLRDWCDAILAAPSNESVSDIVDQQKLRRLTERLTRAIESAFCPDDAKKLTSIVLDWAKHVDDKQVKNTLRPFLRKCDRDGDAHFLRKLLSDFFLALPDPWRTRASSILSALTVKTSG
jgi:hypothetical protein